MADNKASEYEAGLKEKEKKYYAEITDYLREREREREREQIKVYYISVM